MHDDMPLSFSAGVASLVTVGISLSGTIGMSCGADERDSRDARGRQAYVTVDTYRNEEERQRMFDWNLTALTILPPEEWTKLFAEAGYTGENDQELKHLIGRKVAEYHRDHTVPGEVLCHTCHGDEHPSLNF